MHSSRFVSCPESSCTYGVSYQRHVKRLLVMAVLPNRLGPGGGTKRLSEKKLMRALRELKFVRRPTQRRVDGRTKSKWTKIFYPAFQFIHT
eukprot:scaffold14165_cov127-Amphora_coffeaeformis.AAC.1